MEGDYIETSANGDGKRTYKVIALEFHR